MTVRCNCRHGAELLISWHDLEKEINNNNNKVLGKLI